MVRHASNSQHSITIENVRVSNDDSSISKEEYDEEVQTPAEEKSDQDTHPDGGLTAWLIVAGVRPIFLILTIL